MQEGGKKPDRRQEKGPKPSKGVDMIPVDVYRLQIFTDQFIAYLETLAQRQLLSPHMERLMMRILPPEARPEFQKNCNESLNQAYADTRTYHFISHPILPLRFCSSMHCFVEKCPPGTV